MIQILLLALLLCSTIARVDAAIGCTLSNPAQDLKYLFPEMTSYREEAKDLAHVPDGKELYASLKRRLGSDLDPVYEAVDTPYTLYTVFKGDDLFGIVHGVNVPGSGGVIQVFVSVDPKQAAITHMFFQRLESPSATALRSRLFRDQLTGLDLSDFYKHDFYAIVATTGANDRIAALKLPHIDGPGQQDVAATMRGVRKNMVLLDIFVFNRRFEPFYVKAQDALRATGRGD